MSNYIIVGGELYHTDELYHHGVKGQKWGVRKKRTQANSSTKPSSERKQSNIGNSFTKRTVVKTAAKRVGRAVGGGVGSTVAGLAVDVRKERARGNKKAVSAATKKAITKAGAAGVAGVLATAGTKVIISQGAGILLPRKVRKKAAKTVGRIVGASVGIGMTVGREIKYKKSLSAESTNTKQSS